MPCLLSTCPAPASYVPVVALPPPPRAVPVSFVAGYLAGDYCGKLSYAAQLRLAKLNGTSNTAKTEL